MSIPRFVVILDKEGARSNIANVAAAAIRGGADVIQIREKKLPEAEVTEIAGQVVEAIGNPLRVAVNGYPSIAAQLRTHLHLPEAMVLGREEIHLAPGALVSRAIHGAASTVDADYAILGNLFETASKPGKAGLGCERFEQLARVCPIPVLAIGGIEPERVRDVIRHGGHGVAVRSYVISAADPERAARNIKRELDAWKR